MRFILNLLVVSSALAQDWEYLKKTVDKSKFPLLNIDKFLEIYQLQKNDPVRATEESIFGGFCRFEDVNKCREHALVYALYFRKNWLNAPGSALSGIQKKDEAGCREQLNRLCVSDPKCTTTAAGLCKSFFSRPDSAETAKEYLAFRQYLDTLNLQRDTVNG